MDFNLVKSIKIPEGVVTKIQIANTVFWKPADVINAPITAKGEMPVMKIDVKAGDVVVITYFITKQQGYIYDGRKCGLNYYGSVEGTEYPISANDLNKECTITLKIPTTGFLTIGANSTLVGNGTESIGVLSKYSGDIPVGKYIKVKIN
jgi:hypothetical protein